jgi:hypothetical protein
MISALFAQLHLSSAPQESRGPQSTKAFDQQRLSIELHLSIVQHLDRDDFAAYLCVCRAWRRAGLSEDVWPRLADRCLPGLTERVRLEWANNKSIAQGDLFRRSLMLICRRAHGQFTSALENSLRLASEDYFKLDTSSLAVDDNTNPYVDYLDARFSEQMADKAAFSIIAGGHVDTESTKRLLWYSHGRIAWTSSVTSRPLLIIIDNLRTKARKSYSFPGHTTSNFTYETALGSSLFVMASERTMCIWYLLRDTCTSVVLPEAVIRCFTEGETVLVVTIKAELYSWRPEFGMQKIDMSDVTAYKYGNLSKCYFGHFGPKDLDPPLQTSLCLDDTEVIPHGGVRFHLDYIDNFDFILHPQQTEIVFMAAFINKTLVVYEFSNGAWKVHRAPKTTNVAHPYLRYILLRKASSHGDYILCETASEVSWANEHEAKSFGMCCRRASGAIEISVSFNIHTKQCNIARHHFRGLHSPPSFPKGQKEYAIWNRQLFHLCFFTQGFNVLAVDECKQDLDYPDTERRVRLRDDFRIYSAVSEWWSGIDTKKRQRVVATDPGPARWDEDKDLGQGAYHQDVDHCLDTSGVSLVKHFWQRGSSQNKFDVIDSAWQKKYLLGDDEYLIFMRGDSVYTMYSFNEDI